MFLVLYEWSVKPGMEALFEEAWRRGTIAITAKFASYGSRLFRRGEGRYVGAAEWPDEASWRAAIATGMAHDDHEAHAMLAEAVRDGGAPILAMPLVRDLLRRPGDSGSA